MTEIEKLYEDYYRNMDLVRYMDALVKCYSDPSIREYGDNFLEPSQIDEVRDGIKSRLLRMLEIKTALGVAKDDWQLPPIADAKLVKEVKLHG